MGNAINSGNDRRRGGLPTAVLIAIFVIFAIVIGVVGANVFSRGQSGADSVDPALTTTQQKAAERARSLSQLGHRSRAALIHDLTRDNPDDGFSVDDATAAVDSLSLDWNQRALDLIQGLVDYGGYSRDGLMQFLTSPDGGQYTASQAAYAIERVEADWDDQAVQAATSMVEAVAVSRVSLERLLLTRKFTPAQAAYAVEQLDVDYEAEAAEEADEILERDSAVSCDDMIDRLVTVVGFTAEQARAGAEAVGVC